MAICSFFGHRDAPESIRYDLKQTLIDLIENKNVDLFYVGHQGKFDSMVKTELKLFSTVYTHINFFVVVYDIPYYKFTPDEIMNDSLLFPDDSLEETPPKFRMDRRNKWMVEESDYVVTYVCRNYGGAYKFKSLAEKRGKTVINLYREK